jgi:hypothetical protein
MSYRPITVLATIALCIGCPERGAAQDEKAD